MQPTLMRSLAPRAPAAGTPGAAAPAIAALEPRNERREIYGGVDMRLLLVGLRGGMARVAAFSNMYNMATWGQGFWETSVGAHVAVDRERLADFCRRHHIRKLAF